LVPLGWVVAVVGATTVLFREGPWSSGLSTFSTFFTSLSSEREKVDGELRILREGEREKKKGFERGVMIMV